MSQWEAGTSCRNGTVGIPCPSALCSHWVGETALQGRAWGRHWSLVKDMSLIALCG